MKNTVQDGGEGSRGYICLNVKVVNNQIYQMQMADSCEKGNFIKTPDRQKIQQSRSLTFYKYSSKFRIAL